MGRLMLAPSFVIAVGERKLTNHRRTSFDDATVRCVCVQTSVGVWAYMTVQVSIDMRAPICMRASMRMQASKCLRDLIRGSLPHADAH